MLTASIKKSWCITLTTPKLVNLNILSIIHIILGRICFLALKHAISIGTSAVDWWLANTNVLSSKHCDMSSPISTTETNPPLRIETRTRSGWRTFVSQRTAPHRDHGQQPVEKVALYPPEGVRLYQPQRRQERHPDNVRRDAVDVVQHHEATSEQSFRDDVQPPETHFIHSELVWLTVLWVML